MRKPVATLAFIQAQEQQRTTLATASGGVMERKPVVHVSNTG